MTYISDVALPDNSLEEIRDLVEEMLVRLKGTADYTDEDERLQTQYKAFFKPGHCKCGACSRIGRGFLRQSSDLIV